MDRTIPGFGSLAVDVWVFVDRRVSTVLSHLLSAGVAAHEKAKGEVDLARKDVTDRLVGDGETWQLIDRFDSAKNYKFGVEGDFIYWQGLVDGFRLSDKILKGEIVRWLGSAYPAGLPEEPEDGGG